MSAIYDWATTGNLQPEPITVEIWRNLPADFCRQVEVVNGQAVRCDTPGRAHQTAVRRIASLLEAAASDVLATHPSACLDVSTDLDVTLWEVPASTIRRPDATLHDCAAGDYRPLPASYVRMVVEVVSPGSDRVDQVDKMGEYASAGIPFYWLAWIADNHVASIDIHVLDHVAGAYRHFRTLTPEDAVSVVEVPVRIKVPWSQLSTLVR
jgi:Uma2 family endonuclease